MVHYAIQKFALVCVENRLIDGEELDWLIYGIEKRVSFLISGILFFALGSSFSTKTTAAAFLISFYYLRRRTNGYHANTFAGCLIISCLLEIIFLKIILPIVCKVPLIIAFFDFIIVFLYAPYNHKNMNLNHEEILACRKSSRIGVLCLSTLALIANYMGITEISSGIILGNTMTAVLLVIANINNTKETKTWKK